ncbi:hypothetical protein Pcinc_020064 [Petrolisthes cinctipes]|uniref:Uncharacterized protein n=1 Tax=Petrolisthes cinctipes TaxID=88211 RepID=A0AAE1FKB0_PETCI|nr:hypothetical protein Pcinc_020064 [Petrolisthes cinctipes]
MSYLRNTHKQSPRTILYEISYFLAKWGLGEEADRRYWSYLPSLMQMSANGSQVIGKGREKEKQQEEIEELGKKLGKNEGKRRSSMEEMEKKLGKNEGEEVEQHEELGKKRNSRRKSPLCPFLHPFHVPTPTQLSSMSPYPFSMPPYILLPNNTPHAFLYPISTLLHASPFLLNSFPMPPYHLPTLFHTSLPRPNPPP